MRVIEEDRAWFNYVRYGNGGVINPYDYSDGIKVTPFFRGLELTRRIPQHQGTHNHCRGSVERTGTAASWSSDNDNTY